MTENEKTDGTVSVKRCAIYTRKSTDEGLDKEFNSLEAQFDACSSYIRSQSGKGWQLINRHYDDGGFSGGTMNRPALQTLLQDIADGLIDVVVVYKIDRISRSLADFTELTRLLEKYNVSLVSVTQQIDTSTSMGRMIVNLLICFAQHERELTSDRLRDKFAASRRRGMWTGGCLPYGYKTVDHKLVKEETEAPQVLFAFERYELNHSFLQTTRELNERYGARRDGKPWNIMHVRTMLKQAAPAGKVRDPHTGELFDGQHEPIVGFDLWSKVQAMIDSRRKGKRERKGIPQAPLKGIIHCGYCGCAMVPTFCSKEGKRTFHYYRCNATHKHLTESCQLKNISASAIERPVFDLIGKLITNEYFLELLSADHDTLEMFRRLGSDKARCIETMTMDERRRLVQLFVRKIMVRKDGIDMVVRGDGFKHLMGKE